MRALPERGIPPASTRGHMRLPARVGTPTMPLAQRSACAIPKTTLATSARAMRVRGPATRAPAIRATAPATSARACAIRGAPLPTGGPSAGAYIPRNPETLMRTAVLPGTIPLTRKASSKRSSSPKRFLASRSSSASTRKTRLIASCVWRRRFACGGVQGRNGLGASPFLPHAERGIIVRVATHPRR